MRTAYFDCFGGASGDMIVAGLLDAGVSLASLRAHLAKLKLPGYEVTSQRTTRSGLAGTRFLVLLGDGEVAEPATPADLPGQGHSPRRNLADILAILDAAALPPRADSRARQIFRRLAQAEAKVHNVEVDQVHFHEVGAVDSIVDVVAAAVCLEILDVDRVLCSPIPLGRGTVKCAHGIFPVPAPATAELMRDGAIEPTDYPAELCTPTGAAVLTTLAEAFTVLPAMKIDSIGYGAGGRDDPGRVNMLRVFVGVEDADGQADTAVELAANIDNATGELIGAVLEMLLAAGALDAWAAPITMKKSRPAVQLGVLCRPTDVDRLEELLLRQTTTIGVRRHACSRSKLTRRHVTVETPYGPIRMKVAGRGDVEYSAAPEFDDCVRAAEVHNAPIKDVQAAAIQKYRQDA
jgi:pyridinium-3,5-bisthiocarboxylic acid mononucleotide nickel chelatase